MGINFNIDTDPCVLISFSFSASLTGHLHVFSAKNTFFYISCCCICNQVMHFPEITSKFLPANKNRLKQALGT